jgi:hypothetical protein
MKKRVIWIISISVLILLIGRILTRHINGVSSEKAWYISQLDFEFSGELDSADRPGQVLFHVTKGQLNSEKEKEVKAKLTHNGVLDLLLYRNDNKLDIMIIDPHDYVRGDSLYLNSKLNIVRFYRDGKLLGDHDLIKSLRGRPF